MRRLCVSTVKQITLHTLMVITLAFGLLARTTLAFVNDAPYADFQLKTHFSSHHRLHAAVVSKSEANEGSRIHTTARRTEEHPHRAHRHHVSPSLVTFHSFKLGNLTFIELLPLFDLKGETVSLENETRPPSPFSFSDRKSVV